MWWYRPVRESGRSSHGDQFLRRKLDSRRCHTKSETIDYGDSEEPERILRLGRYGLVKLSAVIEGGTIKGRIGHWPLVDACRPDSRMGR